jgi:hypothetical protein
LAIALSNERARAARRQMPALDAMFGDSTHRGYLILDLTPERCVAHVRALDDATRPDSAVSTLAELVIDARHPGARPLT